MARPSRFPDMVLGMALGEVASFDGVAFGTLGDFGVGVWVESARLERMQWMLDHCERVFREQSDSFLALQIIFASSSPPDGPTRTETRRRIPAIDPHLRHFGTVALGDDIQAAIVRTFIRATFMLSPVRSKRFVTATISPALETLLVDRSARTPTRQDAMALVDRCLDVLAVRDDDRAAAFGPLSSSRFPSARP